MNIEVAVKAVGKNTKVPECAQLDDYRYFTECSSICSGYLILSVYDAAARTHILLV